MTISSLNTNLAALVAQLNIGNATSATTNEVAALSSGNRIVNASDDVAALATGTALQSQVNTLNTSLTVASQGSSLLQVADGGLAQIQSILQRQQAIATQAQSGSLSSTQLGFLDEEFQNLTSQIDQLAGSTNFNGVSLINGSISGAAAINTNDAITSTAVTNKVSVLTATANTANGDTITINGFKATFTTAAAGTAAASGDIIVNGTATSQAANIANFLNNANAPQLANLQFTAIGAEVDAVYVGGALQGAAGFSSSTSDATNITITGSLFTLAATTASAIVNTQGAGLNRYTASGAVTGDVLTGEGAGTTQFGSAVDLSLVKNNLAFSGNFGGASIGEISGTFVAAGSASFSVQIGADTYTTGTIAGLTGNAPKPLTFTGYDSGGTAAGGSFTVNLAGGAFTTIADQSDVNSATAQINSALSGVTVSQNRTLTSIQTGSGLVDDSSGTQLANLSGLQATYHGTDFNNLSISSLKITAPTNGGSDATITAVINGDTYTSASGIGNQIGTNSVIGLQDESNPNNYISIVTGNSGIASDATTALDLGTQSKADAVATALGNALGIGSGNASLTFQVGSSTGDTLGVSIGSATSSSLFGGQSLDVKTQADAAVASNSLTSALNTVTALRANVGALEERFNYASNAISSASQNEGAAQSTLLDTDVSSESTKFATSQVQLQAGIAVLAQANQLQQNLLKLIS